MYFGVYIKDVKKHIKAKVQLLWLSYWIFQKVVCNCHKPQENKSADIWKIHSDFYYINLKADQTKVWKQYYLKQLNDRRSHKIKTPSHVTSKSMFVCFYFQFQFTDNICGCVAIIHSFCSFECLFQNITMFRVYSLPV